MNFQSLSLLLLAIICKKVIYGSISDSNFDCKNENIEPILERISFVIPVYQEEEIIVRKTLESLERNTTFENYEIILIDDFNFPPYSFDMPNVRIHRNTKREGLIRSRLNGINIATGSIIVFLDSHVLVNKGSIEKLVNRLLKNNEDYIKGNIAAVENLIVVPVIDTIDEKDFSYSLADSNAIGDIESWNLTYSWRLKRFNNLCLPRPIPVLSGSIFATMKDSFIKYGSFDPMMDIWGGENIELSFRTWLCNGRIEMIPTSRVAHLFRSQHPYNFPEGKIKTVLRNLKRVALLWFLHKSSKSSAISYLANFYNALPEASKFSIGSLEERVNLIRNLNCLPFEWFLENSNTALTELPLKELDGSSIRKAILDIDANFDFLF